MQIGIGQVVPAREKDTASQIQSKRPVLSCFYNPASPASPAHVPVSPNLLRHCVQVERDRAENIFSSLVP